MVIEKAENFDRRFTLKIDRFLSFSFSFENLLVSSKRMSLK